MFTKLVQDRISKISNFLPIVSNLIRFGGVVHDDNQQHDIYTYNSRAVIPFKRAFAVFV